MFPSELTVKDTAEYNSPAITQDPFNSDQSSSQKDEPECHPDPTPTRDIPDPLASSGVDLKDPDKYCALCVASFNNPQMALQHYNGRKHQRKKAKQEFLNELRKDGQQGITAQWIKSRKSTKKEISPCCELILIYIISLVFLFVFCKV